MSASNFIRRRLDLYYHASSTKRNKITFKVIQDLAPMAKKVNHYIQERNRAQIKEALCCFH